MVAIIEQRLSVAHGTAVSDPAAQRCGSQRRYFALVCHHRDVRRKRSAGGYGKDTTVSRSADGNA